MAGFFQSFQAGEAAGGAVGDFFDAKQRREEWKNKLLLQAQQHIAAADALKTEAIKTQFDRSVEADKLDIERRRAAAYEKENDARANELEAEAKSIKSGTGKNGTGGNHASPALLNLREQYKQLSNDVRQKSQPGSHPPSDLIKRYNAVGKALNAQAKHEEPDSVQVDFVPMPETPPNPTDKSFHPLDATMNWFKSMGAKKGGDGEETVTVVSGGKRIPIYKKNLAAAQQRDPNLTVEN